MCAPSPLAAARRSRTGAAVAAVETARCREGGATVEHRSKTRQAGKAGAAAAAPGRLHQLASNSHPGPSALCAEHTGGGCAVLWWREARGSGPSDGRRAQPCCIVHNVCRGQLLVGQRLESSWARLHAAANWADGLVDGVGKGARSSYQVVRQAARSLQHDPQPASEPAGLPAARRGVWRAFRPTPSNDRNLHEPPNLF